MNTLRIASRTLRAFAPLARSTGFDLMQVRTKVTSAKKAAPKKVVKKVKAAPKKVAKKTSKKVVVKKVAKQVKAAALSKKRITLAKKKAAAQKKRVAVMKRNAAVKATAARKKATLAKRKAAVKAVNERKRARVQATKAKVQAKKDAVKAKKAKIASSGPVRPRTLFVKQQAGKGMNLKQMSEKFNTLGASEKQALVNQAQKNLAKRNEIRKSLKKPATKYALFVKKNFATAYESAKKQTNDKKAAFKLATRTLAAQYKKQ
eukprot:TRINITY_DN29_c0_g1_i3.p1 TRINITY_DN29_c0_g1~~TRINITY_DN29_c0_g1_i3.p1  ORF type:complete len:261 (+),score=115.48 TRINITY_DN29_c0_g1_i3:77-859(+)